MRGRQIRHHLLQNQERGSGAEDDQENPDHGNGGAAPPRGFFAFRPIGGDLKVEQLQQLLWRRFGGFGWLRLF